MRCPVCGEKTRVLETRESKRQIIRRRRACKSCGFRFSTFGMQILGVMERLDGHAEEARV
jgi:transcriptional regulator NrdR family protein